VATRYDSGKLRKAHKTAEGALFSEAIYARDGVLEYRLPNGGSRRELRLPETNYDEETLTSYGSKPITVEHPPVLVTADNAKTYQVGASDAEPMYERRYEKGFVGGIVRIWHSDGVDAVERNGKKEVSIGYTCDIEPVGGIYYPKTGTYVVTDAAPDKDGERFDAIQRNVRVNHIALTSKGRAGPEVCLRIDSEDDDVATLLKPFEFRKDEFVIPDSPLPNNTPTTKRMAVIRIDGMDFGEVPETVAVLMNQKLNLITELQSRKDALEIQIQDNEKDLDELREQVDEVADERDRERGRADALELQLTEVESRLDMAAHTKGKKKGKVPIVEVDEDEDFDPDDIDELGDDDEADDEDDEEDMEPTPIPKKKGKRKDSAPADVDPRQLFVAYIDANKIVPGLISEDKLDSFVTPTDVRHLAIQTLNPDIDLTNRSDAYVDGVYDFIKSQKLQAVEQQPEQLERNDSINTVSFVGSHTPPSEIQTAIAQARSNSTPTSPLQGAAEKQRDLYMNSWNKPLDLV